MCFILQSLPAVGLTSIAGKTGRTTQSCNVVTATGCSFFFVAAIFLVEAHTMLRSRPTWFFIEGAVPIYRYTAIPGSRCRVRLQTLERRLLRQIPKLFGKQTRHAAPCCRNSYDSQGSIWYNKSYQVLLLKYYSNIIVAVQHQHNSSSTSKYYSSTTVV